MPGSIGKNRGIAVEGASSESALRAIATPGGLGEQRELMAEFSHLLDQIAVEVQRVADVKTFLKNETPLDVKSSKERFSNFDSNTPHPSSDNTTQLGEKKVTDSNIAATHESVREVESASTVKMEEESGATDQEAAHFIEKNGKLPVEDSDESLMDTDELVSDDSVIDGAEPPQDTPVHEMVTLSEEVSSQLVSQAAVTQKKPISPEGLERPLQEVVREPVMSATEAPQQEVPQKSFMQGEKGEVALPANFQEVTGEEVELLREFSGAVQKTVVQQQVQPQETDQLARIVEGLLQGKVSESGLPQPLATGPVPKDQSELFSSLIQSRVLSGGNEVALSKGLEQLSGLMKAGSQQSNNQAFQQHGHEQLSLGAQKNAESNAGMNKEAFKELSKGQELRTLKKVEEALKEVAKSRDGKTISLRLDPPSLGSVRVEVSIRDGVLHARLAADSAHVNTLLRDKGAELQQVLRGLGIDVNAVNVSVQDDGSQSQQDSNMFSQQENQFERGPRHEGSSSAASAATVSAAESKSSPLADHWVA